MSQPNSWSNPSKVGASEAVQMAAFLEQRSNTADMVGVNHKLNEVMAGKPGERLLEVGSGSGVLCRMVAASIRPSGFITGLDISPEMSTEAYRYARSMGTPSGIVFHVGSAECLPYPEGNFDGAFAARILLHVSNPDQVLGEMARVVKPGGRIVVMDWDYETVTVDHPDRELSRRILNWRTDHHGEENWSGRTLWRRMCTTGLHDISVHPYTAVANHESDSLTQSLFRAAKSACDEGVISSIQQDAWMLELQERIRSGVFFASITYFIVKGIVGMPRISFPEKALHTMNPTEV